MPDILIRKARSIVTMDSDRRELADADLLIPGPVRRAR